MSEELAKKEWENSFAEDAFEPLPEDEKNGEKIVRKNTSYWKDVWRNFKKNKAAMVSLVLMAVMVLFVLIGPEISGYNYYSNDYSAVNQGPSTEHWFGTDNLGRDLWTRVWAGGRVSLLIAILATLIPEAIGMIVGGISGYIGGKVDMIIMRIIDVLMGIPSLIYMILLMVVLGSGNIWTLIIAMSITGWMGSARSTRGLVLQLKSREFVTASETLGASPAWIITRRLIPNTLGIRVVGITMSLPSAIFYEAFLSYIGLGVTPPTPSWGQLIKAAGEVFRYYPYQFIIPCLCVAVTMLCFNLIGDGLRDALDPKLRS
ncbi:MAG: ABC transporter permease [Lachnospiraceae bacterium]|nr:ABC transporter permease [Robinsoniella sp.]MDY3767545.1 ABC transporter permease [Lachnospiraceae bacterium]